MRKKYRLPREGTKKVVTAYLRKPLTLATSPRPFEEDETRWLEWSSWVEEFHDGRWWKMYWCATDAEQVGRLSMMDKLHAFFWRLTRVKTE